MASTPDPILEGELDAYVDGQVDLRRRIEIEAYLAAHPPLASRVMADMRLRDELRCAFGEPEAPADRRAQTLKLARRLEGARSRQRLFVNLRRAAVVMLLVGAGWIANASVGPLLVGAVFASPQPPAYVVDAVMAHRTALLRGEMVSQVETPDYDRTEIRAATAIVLPKLPKDWKVTDVQVFPSKYGPSVQMAMETPDLGLLSFYAVRPGAFGMEPAVARRIDDGVVAAYWQVADVAYTLVGQADEEKLLARADRFAGRIGRAARAEAAR
ncbi:anti-sigma factor family protein [Methylopila turkensis]|uniref:Transcriptional regulator, anti-sigma factor n=1 Tax=Methylopila turkensis TaxID=1437816 RepID=A0A9W6JLJ9_9HYPH|nr:anti-sigma factor [Methylopila turkensis]GLK78636.1 transcriptional regulator, anti-sigma factor [Methylopila turkensis]